MSRDDEIAAAARAAAAEWPTLKLSPQTFITHLTERLGEAGAVQELRAGDLFLACACLHGEAAAWKELDRVHLSKVPAFVARIDASPAFGQEVRQRLAEKLAAGNERSYSSASGRSKEPRSNERSYSSASGRSKEPRSNERSYSSASGRSKEPRSGGRSRLVLYSGRGALGGWLRVAAVREAHDLKRESKGESKTGSPEDGADLVDSTDDPEVALAKRRYAAAFKEAFEDVLKTLSPDRRNVLRLHYLEGLTLDEVGKAYGVSRATAARWIADAREAMITRLGKELAAALGNQDSGPQSVLAYVKSRLDLSLRRQFSMDDPGPLSDDDVEPPAS